MSFINLERLNPYAQKLLKPYLEDFLKVHSDNILSIILYGSAAGKDFIPKISDVNLLIVFRELGFKQFRDSLKVVWRGIANKIPAPLFLTERHIQTSSDVFPVEFLQMKENYVLLYGQDMLKGLVVENAHLRLFCEQQIKGKLIRIRQAYLEIGLKRKGIQTLLKDSLASLMPIFRNMLRLKGKIPPPVEKREILRQLGEEFGVDKDVFIAILPDKRNNKKIASQDTEVFFQKYLDQIQRLAIEIDRI